MILGILLILHSTLLSCGYLIPTLLSCVYLISTLLSCGYTYFNSTELRLPLSQLYRVVVTKDIRELDEMI